MLGAVGRGAGPSANEVRSLRDAHRLERDTWALLRYMYIYSPSDEEHFDKFVLEHDIPVDFSHRRVIAGIRENGGDISLNKKIVAWLESTYSPVCKEVPVSAAWNRTRKRARNGATDVVSEQDPDAPSRLNMPLDRLDQEEDTSVVKTVWQYLRAGKLEEAKKHCRDCDQPWRAATLSGGAYYHVNVDIEGRAETVGNKNLLLWKEMCWELSNKQERTIVNAETRGDDADNSRYLEAERRSNPYAIYDKAIYATLCGNVRHILPACETWEDFLWAKALSRVHRLEEEALRAAVDGNSMFYGDKSSLADDLDNPPQQFVEESKHPFHIIQRLLIVNNKKEVIETLASWLSDEEHRPKWWPVLARFACHLSIYFGDVFDLLWDDERTVQNRDTILKVYVSHLKDLDLREPGHMAETIAQYCSLHRGDIMGRDEFADYLASLNVAFPEDDADDDSVDALLQKCRSYMESFFPDEKNIRAILQGVVHRVCRPSHAQPDRTTIDVKRMIGSVRWLAAHESASVDGLFYVNLILRQLIATGNIDRADELLRRRRKLDVFLVEGVDPIIKQERDCWEVYVSAMQSYSHWCAIFSEEPDLSNEQPQNPGDIAVNIVYNALHENHQRWRQNAEASADDAITNLGTFLGVNTDRSNSAAAWLKVMGDGNESDEALRTGMVSEWCTLARLSRGCIPEIAICLHNVLDRMQRHKNAVDIVNHIASEEMNLYQAFDTNQMQSLLHRVRNSAIKCNL